MLKQPLLQSLFPIGTKVWIPSSPTQPFFRIPKDIDLKFEAKLAFLPVAVKGYDADGRIGQYILEWDESVVIRCNTDQALLRPAKASGEALFIGLEYEDLSHLEHVHDAAIVWELMLKYKKQRYYFRVGSSPCMIVVNPLESDTRLFRNPPPDIMNRSTNRPVRRNSVTIASNNPDKEVKPLMDPLEDLQGYLNNIFRALASSNSLTNSQAIILQGCAGSGKSEIAKYIVQYLIHRSVSPTGQLETDLNPKNPVYCSLGSDKNRFILPEGSESYSKAIVTAMYVLDMFSNAPTSKLQTSSRQMHHIKFIFDQNNNLSACNFDVQYIDLRRLCHVDDQQKPYTSLCALLASITADNNNPLKENLSPQLISYYFKDFNDAEIENLASDFKELETSLTSIGFPNHRFKEIVNCLVACIHLQSVIFEGEDTATLSNDSRIRLGYAEELLGVGYGVLAQMFLVKIEERVGSLRGTATDCRPAEAVAARDIFAHEIYSRIVRYMLDYCSQCVSTVCASTNQNSLYDTQDRYKTVHIIDTPGWEILPTASNSGDIIPRNGFQQMAINYYYEKLTGYYISSSFSSHMRKYSDNPDEISSISFSSSTLGSYQHMESLPYVDVFEKPPTGLISIMEEIGQAIRSDDKAFTDKALFIHTRTKQIRSSGHKVSSLSFVIKHTFGEVVYDTTGFLIENKNRLSQQARDLISTINSPVILDSLRSDVLDGNDDILTMEEIMAGDGALDGSDRKSKALTPRKKSSLDMNSPKNSFQFSKSREFLSKLCLMLDRISCNYILCIRPCLPSLGFFNPDFVAVQVKSLCISSLAQLMKTGYSFCKTYEEFYSFFRVMFSPFHKLPMSLPSNVPTIDQNTVPEVTPVARDLCMKLLNEIFLKANITMNIYDNSGIHSEGIVKEAKSALSKISNKDNHLILLSKHYICLKDRAEQPLLYARSRAMGRMFGVITRLQSRFRMKKQRKIFLAIIARIKRVQAHFRRFTMVRIFKKVLRKTVFLQKNLRMLVKRKLFQRKKEAMRKIFYYLTTTAVYRMRFRHMQRIVAMMQQVARGYLVRQSGIITAKAVDIIKAAMKQYIHRVRFYRMKNQIVVKVQKIIRGYLTRVAQTKFIHILTIRRNQRVAQRVTKKIQSFYRRKYIHRKYKKLRASCIFLQQWIRARFQRRKFLLIKYLTIWTQKHWRRIRASLRVSNMRMAAMALLEESRIWKYKSSELEYFKNIFVPCQSESQFVKSSQNVSPRKSLTIQTNSQALTLYNSSIQPIDSHERLSKYQLGDFVYRNGRTKCTRRVLGYEAHFDLADSYPQTWLKSIMEFSDNLKKNERKSITSISIGAEHTVIVDNTSNFYTFGIGDSGQLGHNNRYSLAKPTLMETMNITIHASEASFSPGMKATTKIVSVCCGRSHTLVLAGSGRMYSWGSNRRGQLGHSHFETCTLPRMVGQDLIETAFNKSAPMNGIISRTIIKISCGAYHSSCIADPGYLYTWGAGSSLGRVQEDDISKRSTNTASSKGAKITMTGRREADHTCPDSSEPTIPPFFSKRRVHDILCGDAHSIARSYTEFYSWGRNSQGQLGIGDFSDTLLPSKVKLPKFSEIDSNSSVLVTGGRHMALLVNGKAWLWGWNSCGQIGNGTTENVNIPTIVTLQGATDKGVSIKQIVAGWEYSAAVTAVNSYIWGSLNVGGEYFPTNSAEANDRARARRLTPSPLIIPEGEFGKTFGLMALNSSTMSVLTVDSEDPFQPSDEDLDNIKPNTLKSTSLVKTGQKLELTLNSESKTFQSTDDINVKTSRINEPNARPFRLTQSSKDVSNSLLRVPRNGAEITSLLQAQMSASYRKKKRMSLLLPSSPAPTVRANLSTKSEFGKNKNDFNIDLENDKQSPKSVGTNRYREGKLKDDAIIEYFTLTKSTKSDKNTEQSKSSLTINTNAKTFSILSAINTNPSAEIPELSLDDLDHLKNSGRGISMPTSERNILLRFTNQRKEQHIKHLNDLLPEHVSTKEAAKVDEIQESSNSGKLKLQRRFKSANRSGSDSLTASRLGLTSESVRSLNNAIESLRLDIRHLELASPRARRTISNYLPLPVTKQSSESKNTPKARTIGGLSTRKTAPSPRGRILNRKRGLDGSEKTEDESKLVAVKNTEVRDSLDYGSGEGKSDLMNTSEARDLAVLLQTIKRENIQQIAGSWKY